MNISELTPQQLRHAADIQEKIQSLQQELENILGGEIPIPVSGNGRGMSAAGRARIAAAARARWARIRAEKGEKPARRKLSAQGLANIRAGVLKRMAAQGKAPSPKPATKRKMSAAAKARLSAIAKARWAKARKAGKKAL